MPKGKPAAYITELNARIAALQGEIADMEAERDRLAGKTGKGARITQRWWIVVARDPSMISPILYATRGDARYHAKHYPDLRAVRATLTWKV